jgi:hypothetical protein
LSDDDTRPPPPYPAETLAKGWRFEVDMERFKRSDTWLRAKGGVLRGLLLLLWSQAWEREPCGTLPNDDELIVLLLDISPEVFAEHRSVLMRGWIEASDGLLYHHIIVERVHAMLVKRAQDAKRSADRREREKGSPPKRKRVTAASRVTHADGTGDSGVSSTPSTKHQAPVIQESAHALSSRAGGAAPAPETPTAVGAIGQALVRGGVQPTTFSTSHPTLIALAEQGATPQEVEDLAREAVQKEVRAPIPWIASTLQGRRADAARLTLAPAPEPVPPIDTTRSAKTWLEEQNQRAAEFEQQRLERLARTGTAKWKRPAA